MTFSFREVDLICFAWILIEKKLSEIFSKLSDFWIRVFWDRLKKGLIKKKVYPFLFYALCWIKNSKITRNVFMISKSFIALFKNLALCVLKPFLFPQKEIAKSSILEYPPFEKSSSHQVSIFLKYQFNFIILLREIFPRRSISSIRMSDIINSFFSFSEEI